MIQSFAVVVGFHPASSQAYTALKFCNTVLLSGYQVYRIFYHNEGILNCCTALQNQHPIISEWEQLIRDKNIDAVCCVNSAHSHDIESSEDLISGVELAGLGQLIDAERFATSVISF